MSEYTPDRWVVIELDNSGVKHQRVFAGWYGGYLDGDSWKINSGITKVEEDAYTYHFHGKSGSIYHCNKSCYGMSMYMASILEGFLSQQTDEMKISVVEGYDNGKKSRK